MKSKIDMAHEMIIAMQSREPITDMALLKKLGWRYADLMHDEADKRKVSGLPEAIQDTGTIKCWSCDEHIKLSHRTQNDGHCPNCNVEIEL